MGCKHEQEMLIGTADGIVCKACGKTFANFTEVLAERGELPQRHALEEPTESKPAEQQEPPKKRTRKKA